MGKCKVYVVFIGRQPGIYDTLDKAKEQVHKFKDGYHKSFNSREEAERAFSEYWGLNDDTDSSVGSCSSSSVGSCSSSSVGSCSSSSVGLCSSSSVGSCSSSSRSHAICRECLHKKDLEYELQKARVERDFAMSLANAYAEMMEKFKSLGCFD